MPIRLIRQFLRLEAASGIILFIMALIALILDNSPWGGFYQHLLEFKLNLLSREVSLISWINEGLMTLFFLLVGLELKREFIEGELAGIRRVILPGIAALGGMLAPAIIYIFLNLQSPIAIKGWAIPTATDIAFAIGVLSLFSKRIPLGLKLFLMALAIFDDMGAIVIIAGFYSHGISILFLSLSALIFILLMVLNKLKIHRLTAYLSLGIILWICVLNSGVHATIAGVLLSLVIPVKDGITPKNGPLYRLEESLHPWVAYLVMPLFAFANAGVSFKGLSWHTLLDPITLGITTGLFLGKQIGVMIFSWITIRLGFAELPHRTTWSALYGVSILCGIGFTMSLFLGSLAFQHDDSIYLVKVRVGVLLGSLISGLIGCFILSKALKKKNLKLVL